MTTILIVTSIASWLAILVLAFLLLGTLRALGLLTWRLEQLEATTPKRLGRDGLKPGKKAPDFTLPDTGGKEVALSDFAGRKLLLVFTQAGCGPCQAVMPELIRLQRKQDLQVIVVNNGDPAITRDLATKAGASFPVLSQEGFAVSKRYEVFTTPFAFLIDGDGVIRSKGIASNRQHLGYVLSGAGNRPKADDGESNATEENSPSVSVSHSLSQMEVSHV